MQLQRPVIIYKMDRGYDTNFTDDDVVGGARTPITCYSSTHTQEEEEEEQQQKTLLCVRSPFDE